MTEKAAVHQSVSAVRLKNGHREVFFNFSLLVSACFIAAQWTQSLRTTICCAIFRDSSRSFAHSFPFWADEKIKSSFILYIYNPIFFWRKGIRSSISSMCTCWLDFAVSKHIWVSGNTWARRLYVGRMTNWRNLNCKSGLFVIEWSQFGEIAMPRDLECRERGKMLGACPTHSNVVCRYYIMVYFSSFPCSKNSDTTRDSQWRESFMGLAGLLRSAQCSTMPKTLIR